MKYEMCENGGGEVYCGPGKKKKNTQFRGCVEVVYHVV